MDVTQVQEHCHPLLGGKALVCVCVYVLCVSLSLFAHVRPLLLWLYLPVLGLSHAVPYRAMPSPHLLIPSFAQCTDFRRDLAVDSSCEFKTNRSKEPWYLAFVTAVRGLHPLPALPHAAACGGAHC